MKNFETSGLPIDVIYKVTSGIPVDIIYNVICGLPIYAQYKVSSGPPIDVLYDDLWFYFRYSIEGNLWSLIDV